MDVLWLTPDKPDDISVGRRRIADQLESRGHSVVLRGTTARTAARSVSERGRFDVVVGTTRAGALAGVPVSRAHGIPLVVDHIDPIRQLEETHPWWLYRTVAVAERAAFRAADHVLFVYEAERERVARDAAHFTKTALGVDYDRFADPDLAAIDAARERLRSYDLSENVAVYVGGLEPLYNVSALLEAVDHLDDWTLLVLGTGSLADEVERAATDSDVVYPGTVPHEEIPGVLRLSDVGVSLVDDAHTLKVLEYGAAGLPVVQVRGRAEDRFGDRVTYCDLDPESIADAVRAAGETDPEALRSFVAEFDWRAIADTYERVLSEAVRRPS